MRGDSVEERRFKGPIRGQLIFALLFLALSILLISQLGDQTKWIKKTKFAAQPRLWPMIALAGMVFFTGLHLWRLPRRRILHVDLQEAKRWLQVIEYCLWFIAYVWVVPNLGYLISTLIFLPALAYRAGWLLIDISKIIWIGNQQWRIFSYNAPLSINCFSYISPS
mgnify:CR=1 FL=1